ncbi:hypothetical protein ACODT5_30380 [Streptomyces sp. 5.8]|uniref:hypothetical protein n=1 Tax=Streptomyces sp. 5.8 TaxID=3406571 RepID=UPI003BB488A0
MRKYADGTSEVLGLAGDLARLRNGRECTTRDLALAVVVYQRFLKNREVHHVPEPSTSPDMLGFQPSLDERLTGDFEDLLTVAELTQLAAAENPDLADYLR